MQNVRIRMNCTSEEKIHEVQSQHRASRVRVVDRHVSRRSTSADRVVEETGMEELWRLCMR
eukprot:scaffold11551_cov144-Cylindrotheca_fusiformis.AAC.2